MTSPAEKLMEEVVKSSYFNHQAPNRNIKTQERNKAPLLVQT
jgi:hypothetical protein